MARFPPLLMTTYRFAEQHCSGDAPLKDYFPRVPLHQEALPLIPASVQDTRAGSSKHQVPPVAAETLALAARQQSGHSVELEPGSTATGKDVVEPAVPGMQAGSGMLSGIQNWDSLFPQALTPPPSHWQQTSAAAPCADAHAHSRTWWPRQDWRQQLEEGSCSKEGLCDQLSSCTASSATDTSMSPLTTEHSICEMLPTQKSGCAQTTVFPPQQIEINVAQGASLPSPGSSDVQAASTPAVQTQSMDTRSVDTHSVDNSCTAWSRRSDAAREAWAMPHQKSSSAQDGAMQEPSVDIHDLLLDSENDIGLQLNDAWPSLQAACGVRQHQQAKQEPEGQPGIIPDGQAEGQADQQPEAQQEVSPAQPENFVLQEHSHADVEELGSVQDAEQNRQQQQTVSDTDTAVQPHQVASASCFVTVSSPNQSSVSHVLEAERQDTASESCSSATAPLPQRPGQLLCEFYVGTGFCKFGQGCKFDHPAQYAVCLNSVGLPLRADELACPFYVKTGACKFGPSCKFDHPE